MPIEARATELPDSILELVNYVPPVISRPKNFKHVIHIEPDPKSPYGLKGLPDEWLQRF